MTDTPETDEAQFGTGRVSVDFARKLERQRDTLKEALEKILDYQGRFAEEDPESIATEALQSLNQNENCDATRSVGHP